MKTVLVFDFSPVNAPTPLECIVVSPSRVT